MKRGTDVILAHARVSEKAIEARLVKKCSAAGALCLKFSSQTQTGYPDRLVLVDGIAVWAELKSAGRRQTPLQARRSRDLNSLGFSVFVIDSADGVDAFMRVIEDLRRDYRRGETVCMDDLIVKGYEV